MNEPISKDACCKGVEARLLQALDLSALDHCFTAKPLVIGGLAMEYYGIRKRGHDIDLILTDADYQALAARYPQSRKDKWGDLFLCFDHLELLRSVFRLDYSFLSAGAVECDACKVVSIEKLFFMKVLAYDNQPEIEKHARDYRLMWDFMLETFQNKDYVAFAMQHTDAYLNAPGGTILEGQYPQG